jgi:hypothetical protein
MLKEETWSFTTTAVRPDGVSMKNSNHHINLQAITPSVQLGHTAGLRLVAEWQQHGPETVLGHAVGKLRLTLARTQSVLSERERLREDKQ